MVNDKYGAINDNNLNVGLVDAKDRRVLNIFHSKNIIYTSTELRPNSLNNGDPAATNNGRTPALLIQVRNIIKVLNINLTIRYGYTLPLTFSIKVKQILIKTEI